MKNNYQYLFKNIGLLTLSNFGSKILVFLLVPLYTSILSTSDYGTYDLFNTSISLIIPIVTINISEGVLRFALDKENDENAIYSIGLKIIIKGLLFLTVLCLINYFFNFYPLLKQNSLYFMLLYFSTVLYQFLTSFIRGIDKVAVLSIASVLNTISILVFNILFLLVIKLGLGGYFLANILGALLPSIYLIYKINSYSIRVTSKKDRALQKEMILYSYPLILNSLGWWINNAADRYIVIAFCGVAVNGIYSVGYKIPSILNIFANIFNQAWVLSSVKSFENDKNSDFFESIYDSYNMVLVILCSVLIAISKILAGFLYANEFYGAWIYVPFLLIANVFGAISGFAGGIFSAAKDSKIYSISTLVGAAFNIIFNFILVCSVGAIGAAISTMLSYFIVWLIRVYMMKKIIQIKIHIVRDIFSYTLLIAQSIMLIYIDNGIMMYLMQLTIVITLIAMFRKEMTNIIFSFFNRIRKK